MPFPARIATAGRIDRGPLMATLAITRTAAAALAHDAELGSTGAGPDGAWTLTGEGTAAGFSVDESHPRLHAPSRPPEGCFGLEVVGGDDFTHSVLPWFGEMHQSELGMGGVLIGVSAAVRLSLRTYLSAREIRVFGAGVALAALVDPAIRLYCAIR